MDLQRTVASSAAAAPMVAAVSQEEGSFVSTFTGTLNKIFSGLVLEEGNHILIKESFKYLDLAKNEEDANWITTAKANLATTLGVLGRKSEVEAEIGELNLKEEKELQAARDADAALEAVRQNREHQRDAYNAEKKALEENLISVRDNLRESGRSFSILEVPNPLTNETVRRVAWAGRYAAPSALVFLPVRNYAPIVAECGKELLTQACAATIIDYPVVIGAALTIGCFCAHRWGSSYERNQQLESNLLEDLGSRQSRYERSIAGLDGRDKALSGEKEGHESALDLARAARIERQDDKRNLERQIDTIRAATAGAIAQRSLKDLQECRDELNEAEEDGGLSAKAAERHNRRGNRALKNVLDSLFLTWVSLAPGLGFVGEAAPAIKGEEGKADA